MPSFERAPHQRRRAGGAWHFRHLLDVGKQLQCAQSRSLPWYDRSKMPSANHTSYGRISGVVSRSGVDGDGGTRAGMAGMAACLKKWSRFRRRLVLSLYLPPARTGKTNAWARRCVMESLLRFVQQHLIGMVGRSERRVLMKYEERIIISTSSPS